MIVFMVWCSLTVASVASMRRHDRQSHGRGENRQGEEGSCEDLGHLCHSQALSLQACAGRTVIGLIDEKASIAARRKRIMQEACAGNVVAAIIGTDAERSAKARVKVFMVVSRWFT